MFDKILIAVDVQDIGNADKLARAALRMCGSDETELHVVNVVPDAGYAIVGAAFAADHGDEIIAVAEEALTAWMAGALPAHAKPHVLRGTIYDQILRAARKIGADAIVVGAHSPELRDYLVGPNAARIVRHADQSVLVVR